jgi:hypothetical protein
MCSRVKYRGDKIYFPQPETRSQTANHASLKRSYLDTLGKTPELRSGKFPNEGWVRLDSIKAGKWKPWHPCHICKWKDFDEKQECGNLKN